MRNKTTQYRINFLSTIMSSGMTFVLFYILAQVVYFGGSGEVYMNLYGEMWLEIIFLFVIFVLSIYHSVWFYKRFKNEIKA